MVASDFFGILDRTPCNTYNAYQRDSREGNCSNLQFCRSITQGLIMMGRPPWLGRPLSNAQTSLTKIRRQSNTFFINGSIRKENLGVHWPVYETKRGSQCEVCFKE